MLIEYQITTKSVHKNEYQCRLSDVRTVVLHAA